MKNPLPKPNNLGFYKTRDIAKFFGVRTRTVREWIDRGYLKATRARPGRKDAKTVNGHWQIEAAHLEEIFQYRPRLTNGLKKQWIPFVGKSRREENAH